MFDVENCNKACEFYTLMPVSNGGNGISHFVLPADRIFPTSCKQWVEATPHVVSLTKEKCWDQSEQIFASSVFWLFSDGGLKKTDLLEHNVHADGIHMWCCNANGSDSPLFGILVILTDFLMYFNWQSYFQSSEAEIHQNDQMRAWVMHGMFQGVLSDIVHYGSIFYYRREP